MSIATVPAATSSPFARVGEAYEELLIAGRQTCRLRDSGNFDAAARDLKRLASELRSVGAETRYVDTLDKAIDLLRKAWCDDRPANQVGLMMIVVVLLREVHVWLWSQPQFNGSGPLDHQGETR